MATQPVGNPRQILTQILQRVGDLSQALMGDQLGEVNNDDLASNNTLEEEVKSIFTECRETASPTDPAVISNEAQMSSVTTAARRQLAISSAQSSSRNATTPLYNARKYFNNQRTAIRNRRSSRSSATPSATSSRTSRLGRRGTIGPFTRDLILLSGPDDKNVPRQGTKVFLQESGHIINAFQFMKEWSDVELILQTAEAFKDKIPPTGTDFEILHSVHTTLVTPTLASGQNITGSNHTRANHILMLLHLL